MTSNTSQTPSNTDKSNSRIVSDNLFYWSNDFYDVLDQVSAINEIRCKYKLQGELQ